MTAAAKQQRIDTAKCGERRKLRFNTIDDVLADVERLAEAERAGKLRCAGNWSPGQIFGHLATWIRFSYEGNPLNPPFFVRWIVRWRKNRYLHEAMPAGVKIPRVEDGTLGTERISLEEGLHSYRAALERLRREKPPKPHTLFGPLTHEEWIAGHLRHAELHLSFMQPR